MSTARILVDDDTGEPLTEAHGDLFALDAADVALLTKGLDALDAHELTPAELALAERLIEVFSVRS